MKIILILRIMAAILFRSGKFYIYEWYHNMKRIRYFTGIGLFPELKIFPNMDNNITSAFK